MYDYFTLTCHKYNVYNVNNYTYYIIKVYNLAAEAAAEHALAEGEPGALPRNLPY